jgi:hypothetical protein
MIIMAHLIEIQGFQSGESLDYYWNYLRALVICNSNYLLNFIFTYKINKIEFQVSCYKESPPKNKIYFYSDYLILNLLILTTLQVSFTALLF